MNYSETTSDALAKEILIYMAKPVNYIALNTNGAEDAAHIINKYLI
jgi:hypothetical protein